MKGILTYFNHWMDCHLTRSTRIFYILLIIITGVQFLKPLLPLTFAAQFHLASGSFVEWSFLQAVPSMYNYSNRIWVSADEYNPQTVREIVALELEHEGEQINHYPLRVASFRLDREEIFQGQVKTIYVRTQYLGRTLISAYEVELSDGKARYTEKETYAR